MTMPRAAAAVRGFFYAVRGRWGLAPNLYWWYIITVKRGSTRQAPYEQKGSEMFDYSTIKQQVLDYVGEYEQGYDLDEVMDEIRAIEPDVQSIDDIDLDDILQRHDVSGK